MEYLLGFYEQAEASVGIACVYINHKEDQTLDKLLLSILKQLIQRRKVISEIVIDAHKTYINDKARPSTEKVLEMLRHEVNSFSDTFVIVDALDECSHGVRVALLKELGRLQPQIHLMVTSRNFEIIADMLKDSVKLDISAQAEDIRAFIKAQIDDPENYRLKDFVRLQPKLQKEIEDEVITTANGMRVPEIPKIAFQNVHLIHLYTQVPVSSPPYRIPHSPIKPLRSSQSSQSSSKDA